MATPNTTQNSIYEAVGRAITQWGFVEERLCAIFATCMGPVTCNQWGTTYGDWAAASAVFYSVENFRSRLGMVDVAVRSRVAFDDQRNEFFNDCWAKLSNKTRELSGRRNKLAHWNVIGDGKDSTLRPLIGSPAYYKTFSIVRTPKGILTASQIGHLEKAFSMLSERLRFFNLALASQPESQSRCAQQVADQLRSVGPSDPNLEALLRRALSWPE